MVAELVGDGEIVGMVRGCIKCVGTGIGAGHVNVGCILGLRVSPKHRRMGIGSKLVKSVEGWAIRNGAQYIYLATEENNAASVNLFVLKHNYARLSSLSIVIYPINGHKKKNPSDDVKIEKLSIEQATSLYKDRLGNRKFFPLDIDSILKEQLSLGTWVSYFKEDHWGGLHCKEEEDNHELIANTPRSWAIISMWKTYEAYKLQVRGAPLLRFFHATLSNIGSKILPCLNVFPSSDLLSNTPFGFLLLYGLYGEGERVGDLMRSLWMFACSTCGTVKDCRVVVTELGLDDPMRDQIPVTTSTPCIDDVWLLKKVNECGTTDDNDWIAMQPLSHVFVDPRDF